MTTTPRRIERVSAALGIRAHQSARAEQDPAEIARHHHADVHHLSGLDDLDDGHPRRTGGFAVVGIARNARVLPDDIGIAVVGSVLMLFADLRKEGKRFLLRFAGRGIADEARFVDDKLLAPPARRRSYRKWNPCLSLLLSEFDVLYLSSLSIGGRSRTRSSRMSPGTVISRQASADAP